MNESGNMKAVMRIPHVVDSSVADDVDAVVIKGLSGVSFRGVAMPILGLRMTAGGLRRGVQSTMVAVGFAHDSPTRRGM